MTTPSSSRTRRREVFVVIRQEVFRRLRESVEIEHSDPSLFEFEDFQPLQ